MEKKLNQILVCPKTGMGKIEKFKNTFFPYFLWVFLLLTANKSVKFVLKSKIKNTSNHQNFMSMESKNRWHLTGGWVPRRLLYIELFFINYLVHFFWLKLYNCTKWVIKGPIENYRIIIFKFSQLSLVSPFFIVNYFLLII